MPAPSYWLADVDGEAFPSKRELQKEADAVVVGGGVIGVATAYWLARLGRRPLLLESRTLAWGASGRNAGLMLGGRAQLDDIRPVLREERIDADYEQCGHLALASSDSVMERIRAEVAARDPVASPLRALDRAECEELLRMRIGARFIGGRWLPDGAALHPVRFVHGLAHAAQRRGAAIATRTKVLAIDGNEVTTARGRVRASDVVVACNARSADLLPGARTLLAPVRAQMSSTEPLGRVFRVGLAVDWGTAYWRQIADGTIVIGGAPASLLGEAFPGFPSVRVARRWTAVMDVTPDGRPLVGRWPGAPGIWIAAGFGGHGLPPALGAGRALAEAIVTGRTAGAHEPARFEKEVA